MPGRFGSDTSGATPESCLRHGRNRRSTIIPNASPPVPHLDLVDQGLVVGTIGGLLELQELTLGRLDPVHGLRGQPLQAQDAPLAPYTAEYDVIRNGKTLGSSRVSLSRDGSNWRYDADTTGDRGMAS